MMQEGLLWGQMDVEIAGSYRCFTLLLDTSGRLFNSKDAIIDPRRTPLHVSPSGDQASSI